jgi:hypothetical protein
VDGLERQTQRQVICHRGIRIPRDEALSAPKGKSTKPLATPVCVPLRLLDSARGLLIMVNGRSLVEKDDHI